MPANPDLSAIRKSAAKFVITVMTAAIIRKYARTAFALPIMNRNVFYLKIATHPVHAKQQPGSSAAKVNVFIKKFPPARPVLIMMLAS